MCAALCLATAQQPQQPQERRKPHLAERGRAAAPGTGEWAHCNARVCSSVCLCTVLTVCCHCLLVLQSRDIERAVPVGKLRGHTVTEDVLLDWLRRHKYVEHTARWCAISQPLTIYTIYRITLHSSRVTTTAVTLISGTTSMLHWHQVDWVRSHAWLVLVSVNCPYKTCTHPVAVSVCSPWLQQCCARKSWRGAGPRRKKHSFTVPCAAGACVITHIVDVVRRIDL